MRKQLQPPAPRPPVRLTVTVPAELADLIRMRAREPAAGSVAEVVRYALWRHFGRPGETGRRK